MKRYGTCIALIPVKYRENITGFDLITDGYDGVVAHVMPSMDDREIGCLV